MTLRNFLVWTIFLLLGSIWYTHVHRLPLPGVVAEEEPQQVMVTGAEGWLAKDSRYSITPLATYAIHARVLSAKHYHDEAAWLIPVDLGLAWGRMSDSAYYSTMDFSQRGRFLIFETGKTLPVPQQELLTHCSNNHIIPANSEIAEVLASVHRHEVITMQGYLVEIRGPNGFHMRSSLTREDTGNHACEVFWVDSILVEPPQWP